MIPYRLLMALGIAAAALLPGAPPASAAEVAGVKLEERVKVGTADLALNGAGLRRRFVFDVYVIGLYVPQKGADPNALIAQPGPKRVHIHMLRDVGAGQFTEALADGIKENHTEAQAKALEPRVAELAAAMNRIGEAKKGMAIALDWTGAGTQLSVNGKPAGPPIAGEDFYRALLRIWLGERPVQDDLKRALVGR